MGHRTNYNDKQRVARAKKSVDGLSKKKSVKSIVHFDLPKSTKVMNADPPLATDMMLLHNKVCRDIVKEHGGRFIKEMGDAVLATFDDSGAACECAVRVIRAFKAHVKDIRTKVTITSGTVFMVKTDKREDIYGRPMHRSSRISKYAAPNSVIMDPHVREIVKYSMPNDRKISFSQKQIKLDYAGSFVAWQMMVR